MFAPKEKKRQPVSRPPHDLQHHVNRKGRSLPAIPGFKRNQSNDVIQRKVGLEFESQDQVIKDEFNIEDNSFSKKTIATGQGFKLVGDEAKMEFITDPVDETNDGRVALEKQLVGITQFMGTLEVGENRLSELKGLTLATDNSTSQFNLPVAQDVLPFHPQASAGIELDSLYNLMTAFLDAPMKGQSKNDSESPAWTPGEKNAKPGKKPKQYANNLGWDARHNYPDMQKALVQSHKEIVQTEFVSDRVRSLLFLALSYANSVTMVEKSQNHLESKFWMSFMSRSNVSDVYKSLEEDEKIEFHEKIEDLNDIFRLKTYFNTYNNGSDLTLIGNDNWQDWMRQLGVHDKLAIGPSAYGTIHNNNTYDQFETTGATDIGKTDTSNGDRMKGIIVEMRSLGANVTSPHFKNFGLSVLELVRSVHAMQKGKTHGNQPYGLKERATENGESENKDCCAVM